MENKNIIISFVAAFIISIISVTGYSVIFAKSLEPSDENSIVLINDYEAKIKELVEELTLLKGKLTRLTLENERLQDELSSLKQFQQERETQLEILEGTNTQLIQVKVNLEKQIQDLNRLLSQTTVDKDFQIKQYQDQINQFKQLGQEVKVESQELIKQNAWLKEQYINDHKINDELKQQITSLQKEKDTLVNSVKQAEKTINDLKAENDMIFKQNQQSSQELNNYLAKLKDKEQLEKRNEAVRQAYLALKEIYQQLEQQYKQLQEKDKASAQEFKTSKAKIQSLEFAFLQLKEEKQQLEKKVQQLQDSIKVSPRELNDLKAKSGGLETELTKLKETHQQVEQQYKQLQETTKASAQEFNELKAKSGGLETELTKLKETHQQVEQQYKQLQETTKASVQQLEDLRAANKQLEPLTKQMGNLQADNKKLQTDYEKLAKENESLKAKIMKENISSRLTKVMQLNDQLAKENSILHYNLGVCYTQIQNFDRAVLEFEKVLKLAPNDSETHYNLGVIYAEQLKKPEKALEHFKKYLNLTPEDVDADRARRYVITHETMEQKN
jgi:chromosome segregation ATPase